MVVLTVAVSSFLALILAEIVLQVTLRVPGVLHHPDEVTGHRLIPGASGWHLDEARHYIQVNRLGQRSKERPLRKPPGTLRIAVLGDSFAEAPHVAIDETFWSVLERDLAACPKLSRTRVEVINFGVSGFGTAQQYLLLQDEVWRHDPDVVLLAFYVGNDVTENSRSLRSASAAAAGGVAAPYFVLRDGALVLDDSFRESDLFRRHDSTFGSCYRWMQRHSRVFYLVNEARRDLRLWSNRRGSAGDPQHDLQVGLEDGVYRSPESRDWKDAWAVTEELLRVVRDEVASRGAQFFLAVLSTAPQVHPDPAVRSAFREAIGVTHLFYPDERMREFADDESISAVILAPRLMAYADSSGLPLHGRAETAGWGHWNPLGHRVAGAWMAEALCEQLPLVPPDRSSVDP